jgi:hypothetical protein
MDLDEGGRLNKVFFVMEGATEYWAQNGEDNVIMYDKTHNCNRAGLKLGCGVGVSQEGLTQVTFVSLVMSQDAESFSWVFDHIKKAFRVPPQVIFTDSDPAMARALRETLSKTVHLLCTWHLSRNLVTNMKPTCGKNWSALEKKWWAICKAADLTCLETFDSEWTELLGLLPSLPTDDEDAARKRSVALEWLDKLKEKKVQWAARWTWAHCTAGVHSTQLWTSSWLANTAEQQTYILQRMFLSISKLLGTAMQTYAQAIFDTANYLDSGWSHC